jgi:hypothetical protein
LLRSKVGAHDLDPAADPMEWWTKHHFVSHHLSKATEMKSAIEERFQIVEEASVPYLYRYLSNDAPSDLDNSEVEQAILLEEARLVAEGKIKAIGYRVVAVKKDAQ